MKFAAGNAQHIGARSQQQDAFGFSDPKDRAFTEHAGLLGVVADGMGGMARGREASHAAVRSFLQAYQAKSPSESIPQALARALSEANRSVLSLGSNNPEETRAGTTLVAAVIHCNGLQWISAGDSRVYLLRDSSLTQVTMDHVYARELNEQVAQGKISRAEALGHPERSSLTSYLGMPELSAVDQSVRPLPLEADDCIVLCTDGLYRALSGQEIATAFQEDLHGACDQLIRRALEKHRAQQDNLTVIALRNEAGSARYLGAHNRRFSRTRSLTIAGALVVVFLLGAAAWHWKQMLAETIRTSTHSDEGSMLTRTPSATDADSIGKPVTDHNVTEEPNSHPGETHHGDTSSSGAAASRHSGSKSSQSPQAGESEELPDFQHGTPASENISARPKQESSNKEINAVDQTSDRSEAGKPPTPSATPAQPKAEENKGVSDKPDPKQRAPEPEKPAPPKASPPRPPKDTADLPNSRESQNTVAERVNSNKTNPATKAIKATVRRFKDFFSDRKPDGDEPKSPQ